MKAARWQMIFLVLGCFLTMGSLVMLYHQGLARSFFHQDDVVELAVVADWKGWTTLGHMNNEHLNITFWPLLRLEWFLFGINFAPYLTINVLLHVMVLVLIFAITYKLTKSLIWASLPVWGMVINANWFSVVWWITGQMFLLATIFALLSYYVVLKIGGDPDRKDLNYWLLVLSILPGLSWGIGLIWPTWLFLVFGVDYAKRRTNRIGVTMLAAQTILIITYFSLVGNSLSVHTDPRTWLEQPIKIVQFAIVGVRNTLVGRWLWPRENLKVRAVAEVALAMIFLVTLSLKKLWNKNIIFGLLVVLGSFVTLAIPRWRFGVGQAMANYYAYFPLPFLLISLSLYLSKLKLPKLKVLLIMAVFLIHIPLSWLGFEDWARNWVVRPQRTREYFQLLNSVTPTTCLENRFLPDYIVPQGIWRIDFLWPVFKKDFSPFCEIKNNK